jgi:hypothetical protein
VSLAIQKLVLDPKTFMSQTVVDGHLMRMIRTKEDDGLAWQLLEYEDAYAKRHILRCFGKGSRIRLECPETWWQHLKLALRRRWPRLFGRLRVHMTAVEHETGAVIANLPAPIRADRVVIPYLMPVTDRAWTSDPSQERD